MLTILMDEYDEKAVKMLQFLQKKKLYKNGFISRFNYRTTLVTVSTMGLKIILICRHTKSSPDEMITYKTNANESKICVKII